MVARSAPATLMPTGALDARGQHVDAVADGRHPDVGQARHLHDPVELLDQLVGRHAGAPLLARLELDGRLEHLQRRRVGGRVGATRLAEHALDLRHRLDEAVGLLQQLERPWTPRGPGSADGMYSRSPSSSGGMNSPPSRITGTAVIARTTAAMTSVRLREPQHGLERRPVDRHEEAVERVGGLLRDAAADEVAHQHRHQRDRQPCGGRHRVGLGERQRREQPALLRLEREHRQERQRDDEQREEERRPHFDGGFASPALQRSRDLGCRPCSASKCLDVLVRGLDQDDRRIDHRARWRWRCRRATGCSR